MYTVYILRTSSDTLYIGQTKDLAKRLAEHQKKTPKSAKYLRYYASFSLVYTEAQESRGDALRREAELRRFSRKEKEVLIAGWKPI